MENVLGTSRAAPIFEFRDLASSTGDKLETDLKKLEDAVVAMHKNHNGPLKKRESLLDLFRRAGSTTNPAAASGNNPGGNNDKQPDSCKRKCPKGQVSATVNGKQKCQDKCPEGQQKNAAGDTCLDKCPSGQAHTGDNDACQACKNGQEPNLDGNKCQDKCKDGEAKVGDNGACKKCDNGQKPSADGTKCEDDKCKPGQVKQGPDNKCGDCPAGKVPSADGKTCEDDKCKSGQVKQGPDQKCGDCPAGKKPADDGKSCVDDKCKDGEAKIGDKGSCKGCPPGQKPTPAGDKCFDPEQEKRDQRKKDFEDKKTSFKSSSGGGLRSLGGALSVGAGIAELLKLIPDNVPWDYQGNVDMCAVAMGTYRGGNCKTTVSCAVDGDKVYDSEWQVCYAGGVQHFTDDRIGDFTVEFSMKESDRCPEGLCRPILTVANFSNGTPIDAEQENYNEYHTPGGRGICHNGLTDKADDMSEVSGKDFWWVCAVPNL